MPARLFALAAGALAVFGFAPFAMPLVTLAALLVLFVLWSRATPREAGWIGFAFGLGLFGVGASWIYIAVETFGGMPAPIAGFATAIYVAYLALWPALAGWIATRVTPANSAARLVAAAAAFTLAEWLRAWGFLGVTWFAIGNAELLPEGGLPLAGYAPTGGVFLVTLAVASCAAALVGLITALADGQLRRAVACLAAIAVLVVAGEAQLRIEWTQPHGAPVSISLVQGNVQQADKFRKDFLPRTYELYDELIRRAKGRIVVLPESAYPQFADEIPGSVFLTLDAAARSREGGILVGLFVAEPPAKPGEGERIHNSVVGLGGPQPQLYRKHHLVPFGESLPLKPLTGWFINSVLSIPLADQTAGPPGQRPFAIGNQRLAVNICYEDVFGAELIESARQATLLVNVTNDAWYGRSVAAHQHNQISAMRALETGRPMLRATNTGITSAIAHDGRVIAQLPWFTRGILEVEIAGRTGDTPYLRMGDWLAAGLAALLLAAAALISRRSRSSASENR